MRIYCVAYFTRTTKSQGKRDVNFRFFVELKLSGGSIFKAVQHLDCSFSLLKTSAKLCRWRKSPKIEQSMKYVTVSKGGFYSSSEKKALQSFPKTSLKLALKGEANNGRSTCP
jgi:hypothetical protein